MSETVRLEIERQDFAAQVVAVEDAYELRWNDFVTNEWSERFDSLASAVVGLGVLVQAIEDGTAAHFGSMVPRIRDAFKVAT